MKFEKKYAPKTISEFVFPDGSMKSKVQQFIAKDMDGHLLMYGNYGSGKTTLANLIPLEVVWKIDPTIKELDYLDLAGDEVTAASINMIRTAASLYHPQLPRQVIVIDEADTIPAKAMQRMKKVIDDTERNCSDIFCTNHVDKMDQGIVSRCVGLPFTKSDTQAMADRAKDILSNEGVSLSDAVITPIVKKSKGDFRALLQDLEYLCNQVPTQKAA